MRKPGALHHARFMASSLYILEITMLQNNLPRGMLTPNMKARITRMTPFISLFHAPHFLKAILAAAAPRLDLKLWQDMERYNFIDPSVALEVQSSLLRHQWYLHKN